MDGGDESNVSIANELENVNYNLERVVRALELIAQILNKR